MSIPLLVILKHNDKVYVVRRDDLHRVNPNSNLDFDVAVITRANDWKKGLLHNLQAAIAYDDDALMRLGLDGAQDGGGG